MNSQKSECEILIIGRDHVVEYGGIYGNGMYLYVFIIYVLWNKWL